MEQKFRTERIRQVKSQIIYLTTFVLTGSGSATSPRCCIGDGRMIGVASENNKNASILHTRGA